MKMDALLKMLNSRVEFLVNRFPMMEKALDKISEEVEKGVINKKTLPELLSLYQKVFVFYHNSLDLIRKIYVYFPAPGTDDEEIMVLVGRLKLENKRLIKLAIQELLNGQCIPQEENNANRSDATEFTDKEATGEGSSSRP